MGIDQQNIDKIHIGVITKEEINNTEQFWTKLTSLEN